MVQISTRVAAAEKTRDIQLSFTLKNVSTSDLIVPDFHDAKLNVTYFFDLEAHEKSVVSEPLKLLRFAAAAKAPHAPPQKVKLKPGSEYAYVIPLNLWSVINATPPLYREFAPGTYTVQGIWRPTMAKNEMTKLGLTWFEANQVETSEPANLNIPR